MKMKLIKKRLTLIIIISMSFRKAIQKPKWLMINGKRKTTRKNQENYKLFIQIVLILF